MARQIEIEDLMTGVAKGNRNSFERLYELTAPRLFGVAAFLLRDRAAAEEVLQQVYVGIWEHGGEARPHGLTPMAWLIGQTREACVAVLRSGRHAGLGMPTDEMARMAEQSSGMGSDLGEDLRAALQHLPPEQGDAIRAAYFQGLSYADLAKTGVVEAAQIRPWMQRALTGLRAELADE